MLSVQADRITPEHWDAVGAAHDTPVMGTEGGREFTRVMLGDTLDMDYDAAERDVLEAGEALLRKHSEVSAIVCENHNMVPYAAALLRAAGCADGGHVAGAAGEMTEPPGRQGNQE